MPMNKSRYLTTVHHFAFIFFFAACLSTFSVFAQGTVVNDKTFFTEESLIDITLTADFKKMIKEKLKPEFQKKYYNVQVSLVFSDSSKITEEAEIRPRGKFRRQECYLPPVMINFKTKQSKLLKKLGRLKIVWPCENDTYHEQLILKEYLVYKMYSLLTGISFRVRLAKVNCLDLNEKTKPRNFYAFFIEDVDAMARRNNFEEIQDRKFFTEQTDRQQTTLVALFQYLIGNTDWAVPIYRNIKLVRSIADSSLAPLVVPYDFDYCGMVNASYASPIPELGINSVRERLYQGFPRTLAELQIAIQHFLNQRDQMNNLIMNFEPLSAGNKTEMKRYLDDFFAIVTDEKKIKRLFIDNAKKQ